MITAVHHRGATIGQPIQRSTAYTNAAADRPPEQRAMEADLDAVEISLKIFDENQDETLDARDAVISFTHLVNEYAGARNTQINKESGVDKALLAYQTRLNDQLEKDLSAAKDARDQDTHDEGQSQGSEVKQSVDFAKTVDITV